MSSKADMHAMDTTEAAFEAEGPSNMMTTEVAPDPILHGTQVVPKSVEVATKGSPNGAKEAKI